MLSGLPPSLHLLGVVGTAEKCQEQPSAGAHLNTPWEAGPKIVILRFQSRGPGRQLARADDRLRMT
jgi:hypothetical protein